MRRQPVIVGIALTACFLALVSAWFVLALMRGEHRVERPGGGWVIESIRHTDSQAASRSLYYDANTRRFHIADLVHQYRYYGDDCIIFGASNGGRERYYVACGEHVPYQLDSDVQGWTLESDGVQAYDPIATSTPQRTIGITHLKQIAKSQPLYK